MTEQPLLLPITRLPGIGSKRADAFGRLGIFTLKDLLFHYPRAYEDRTAYKKIIELTHEENVCIKAVVTSDMQTNIIRKNLRICTLKVSDGTGFLELVWFNNRFLESRFKKGQTYIFYGKVRLSPKKQMLTPVFELPEEQKKTGRIIPLYPLTDGLTEALMADCVQQALARCESMPDFLPAALRADFQLCDIHFALKNIHFPAGKQEYELARRRLVFEEFFFFQLALFSIKAQQASGNAPVFNASPQSFINALPFSLTGAQTHVIDEIAADLASEKAMNRLVCGDVGSGKTVVAAAAVFIAVQSGYQAAFMAPTEILATQHYENLQKLFTPHGISVRLLSGSLPAAEKRDVLAGLRENHIQVVVGTHALLSQNVQFHRLGLAVTDEQHRFGVNQRRLLADKGENAHILVMSATPIPRTLALILYGDLNVSVIDELPPGRQKIKTYAVGESYRKRIYAFLQKELSAGRQAYIVCPLIEDSEKTELRSVTEYAKQLQEFFPETPIGILHGKMKPEEKDAAYTAFKNGSTSILVATSVIEVGIDVSNATVILIENAERYGLSQLHQLRGRVGRGTAESYCILLAQSGQENAIARLNVMKSESDGFKIAEADLKQRGPGEFFGTRQHGMPAFKLANLYTDMSLLTETTQAAHSFLEGKIACTAAEKKLVFDKIDLLFDNHVTFN